MTDFDLHTCMNKPQNKILGPFQKTVKLDQLSIYRRLIEIKECKHFQNFK